MADNDWQKPEHHFVRPYCMLFEYIYIYIDMIMVINLDISGIFLMFGLIIGFVWQTIKKTINVWFDAFDGGWYEAFQELVRQI